MTWEKCKRKERVRYYRLRKDTKRVCARAKIEEAAQEKRERAAKREPLREKEDNQEKAVCGEEKKKSKVLPPFKEIISMCMRVKKNKRDFSLTVRHTQELL